MKKITLESIGEILQHIYDSEIHFRMEWMWDGGLEYGIGSEFLAYIHKANQKLEFTGESDLVKGFEWVCKDLMKKHPNSGFTKWFKSKYSVPQPSAPHSKQSQ